MNASQPPRELDALELELKQLLVQPEPEWRARVLRDVGLELHQQRLRSWRWYSAAVAAALVLWTNLSWTVSRDTSYNWRSPESGQVTAEQIERLVPGLSKREATRQALLLERGRNFSGSATALAPISASLHLRHSHSY